MMAFAKIFRDRIIEPVLNDIGYYSPAAANLLLGTALHESGALRYVHQDGGPAMGAYQMEPATLADLFENGLGSRKHLLMRYSEGALLPTDPVNLYNVRYATVAARLQYYRQPEALPDADDLDGLAAYWKKYWNTSLGAGRVEQFVHAMEKYT